MKALQCQEADGFQVVVGIGEPTLDPEATICNARAQLRQTDQWAEFERALAACLDPNASDEERAEVKRQFFGLAEWALGAQREIAERHPCYFSIPGETNVSNETAAQFAEQLDELGPRERLTIGGDVIQDHRERRAWRCGPSGRWVSVTIERLGETLLSGYRWSEDITPVELVEIREQEEHDRITAMGTFERRAAANVEIERALDALAAARSRAEIRGEYCSLEALQDEYQRAKTRIEKKYQLTS